MYYSQHGHDKEIKKGTQKKLKILTRRCWNDNEYKANVLKTIHHLMVHMKTALINK